MSRSAAAAMSATNPKPVGTELYEQVGLQDSHPHYMTTNCSQQLQVATSPPLSGDKATIKLSKRSLIALIVAFFVCAVIVSLVAVVMYSPLVQGSTGAQESALLARIQQLEGTMQAVQRLQGTNTSFESLQEAMALVQAKLQQQADYDATVSSQFAVVHNSMQSLSLYNKPP